MEDNETWAQLRQRIDDLVMEASEGDAKRQRFLRRKLENWAINRGSGQAMDLKARLKKEIHNLQNGLCAECGEPLALKNWELDRLSAEWADEPDQGYRLGNVRGVHPHCNPRGPHPAGRPPATSGRPPTRC